MGAPPASDVCVGVDLDAWRGAVASAATCVDMDVDACESAGAGTGTDTGVGVCGGVGVWRGADAGTDTSLMESGRLGVGAGEGVGADGSAGAGAGVDIRLGGADKSIGSVVLKPRSLIVSLYGFTVRSWGMMPAFDCCDDMIPEDSSEELSVPSGVESESNRRRGERRFPARLHWSSSSPSTLGLGRFFDSMSGVTCTFGSPV